MDLSGVSPLAELLRSPNESVGSIAKLPVRFCLIGIRSPYYHSR